jgi:hypothetical protein
MKLAGAAALYFLLVFGAGFLLGPLRVLLLEPRLGPVAAVLCEAPLLILAIYLAARWVPRVLGVPRDSATLVVIGVGALALQQVADFLVGFGLRGMTFADQMARVRTTEGMIYVALLIVFVAMPLVVDRAIARRCRTTAS